MIRQEEQWRYTTVTGTDYVMCPLVDREIENIDCIENSAAVDKILKKDSVPTCYKEKADWEEICKKCKWHDY